jgi:3-deoxy-D-arabino-heptulosonate 7-phosphate (DAHP) synthase
MNYFEISAASDPRQQLLFDEFVAAVQQLRQAKDSQVV